MLERRAGADQSGGNKLRETDVERTEGKKEQGKGREETRVLRRGKDEWKEVCERRGIRKGKRGVEKTQKKKKQQKRNQSHRHRGLNTGGK